IDQVIFWVCPSEGAGKTGVAKTFYGRAPGCVSIFKVRYYGPVETQSSPVSDFAILAAGKLGHCSAVNVPLSSIQTKMQIHFHQFCQVIGIAKQSCMTRNTP